MGSEASVMIGDDLVGGAIVGEDMLDVEVGNIGSGDCFMAGNEKGSF